MHAAEAAPAFEPFLEEHCFDCHDADTKKGGLDLTALKFDPSDPKAFSTWVKVHDRVRDHEMPPKKKAQPDAVTAGDFLKQVAEPLAAADRAREASEGRSTWRRLNRYEYENTLRDLLGAPWLQIKDMLPEDGEAFRFNKVGDALDVSHVQMARYLGAADYALHQVVQNGAEQPQTKTARYYARDQGSFAKKMKFSVFNRSPERATFAILGSQAQPDVLDEKAPMTVGDKDPEIREQEAVGVVASTYEPLEIKFEQFKAPSAGRYRLRFSAYSFWAGPGDGAKWWIPDRKKVSEGRRSEPVVIYSETPPRLLRRLGAFDVQIEPSVQQLDVYLLAGETIRPDAVRLFRSRPPAWHNPLATEEGMPGVAFRWMEVEGPIYDEWPTQGQRLLFDDLPIARAGKGIQVATANPEGDAERLLKRFMQRAYRRPVSDADVQPFLGITRHALQSGTDFADALFAGYTGILCSPGFICLEEKPGTLDDHALAARLGYFISNSEPDATLRQAAERGDLHEPAILRAQTERLLNDPRSRRFTDAFLDYWLDLRKANNTSPDAGLYPDYYLDDMLVESSVEETQRFFAELVNHDLPSRNIVASDFVMVNERLAQHYGLFADETDISESDSSPSTYTGPARRALVEGCQFQRLQLPPDSPRGGLLTQASVLKVTANGTTTSPVLRGAWIMERILGWRPPPPPPGLPAVEPDIRGASTIREQLDKHRTLESCNVCHVRIDPTGFALESFDVLGGWRDQYRALGDGKKETGFGKNGQPFAFHRAQPVDSSGELPDGRKFQGIRELKTLLLQDERQIARNLAQQLIVFATGSPVRFGDRPELERILDRTAGSHFGVRSLIYEIVQSDLFRNK